MAAEAFYFFLDEKVTKNHSAKMLLCRTGPLPCKSGKTAGYVILRFSHYSTAAKSLMPLPHAQCQQFYLLSSEAVRLILRKTQYFY
jgi:hypothetical protein